MPTPCTAYDITYCITYDIKRKLYIDGWSRSSGHGHGYKGHGEGQGQQVNQRGQDGGTLEAQWTTEGRRKGIGAQEQRTESKAEANSVRGRGSKLTREGRPEGQWVQNGSWRAGGRWQRHENGQRRAEGMGFGPAS